MLRTIAASKVRAFFFWFFKGPDTLAAGRHPSLIRRSVGGSLGLMMTALSKRVLVVPVRGCRLAREVDRDTHWRDCRRMRLGSEREIESERER